MGLCCENLRIPLAIPPCGVLATYCSALSRLFSTITSKSTYTPPHLHRRLALPTSLICTLYTQHTLIESSNYEKTVIDRHWVWIDRESTYEKTCGRDHVVKIGEFSHLQFICLFYAQPLNMSSQLKSAELLSNQKGFKFHYQELNWFQPSTFN